MRILILPQWLDTAMNLLILIITQISLSILLIFKGLEGVAVWNGNLYVVDRENHRIICVSLK